MQTQVFRIRDRKVFLHFHDDYDPNEPRESSGKWTSGGGGAATKAEPTKAPRTTISSSFQPLEKGDPIPKHIQKLLGAKKIPPKWTNVRYNPDPKATGLIVTGRDSKGRTQPLYSEKHDKSQAAKKFGRTQILDAGKFDKIMAKNQQCRRSRDARTRDLAGVAALVMNTGIRPGSETDTGADYKSYGATTLEGRHVVTDEEGNVSLTFVAGKHKGKDVTLKVTDAEVAKDLQDRAKQAGENGQIFPAADARRLLAHFKSIAGKDFKTKDFRTLIGTKVAGNEVANMPVPKDPKEYKRFCTAVATKVSETLGNTPAVALQSYIAPHVFAEWKAASGA